MSLFLNRGQTLRRVVGSIAIAAALAACGGGTSQYDKFEPGRVIAFGDENSLLTSEGKRWSINNITTDETTKVDTFSCSSNPIWVQRVASNYDYVFAECNPKSAAVKAFFRASNGAVVDDLQAQIDAQVAAGGFRSDDLTTVMIGANDILALYKQYPTRTAEDLKNDAADRGKALAKQVNRIVELGGKVLLSDLPDMGLSPYALAEKAANTDVDRAELITSLVDAFNVALGTNILIDGRYIGLVQSNTRSKLMKKSPGSFELKNVKESACLASAELPDCNTKTLVEGAGNSTYLWADEWHFSPRAHYEFGRLAIARAEDNPF
ncbi:SGNH/GDSL hydrolase family protein [Rubrivivax gelatinosus]|uniref:SGNH/GDSL hydrolase family protein n=1 Tax=Rubrivivax gelatinosus TaxID=28068 RepID=UPI000319680C|nr:SGNH/GDSL hydrolase family protein [Rubrivivax gelatinosus]MBG6080432.1 phospholipase/lecithinase/hemolysin [Rubrivivax gelatinosus]